MSWKVGCWGRSGSNSARIAARIAERAGLEVVDFYAEPEAQMPDQLVIVAPNYGDAEVQEDVERFLLSRGQGVKEWVVVEIGNYGGFDDWSFGARERIARFLKQIGKSDETVPGVGIDTLPRVDWSTLDRWCDVVLRQEVKDVG